MALPGGLSAAAGTDNSPAAATAPARTVLVFAALKELSWLSATRATDRLVTAPPER